ncbi:hypothetical protein SUDANB58_05207 [Streptomyces sp. enrichment culture]
MAGGWSRRPGRRAREKATIACLTFGERGESAKAWREGRKPGEIKAIRREQAEKAAATLGAEVRFFDAGDYPLIPTAEPADRLVAVHRETRPDVVLTHPVEDPYNGDHPAASRMALEARVLAQAIGYPGPGEVIGAPPVFCFEPHQPRDRARAGALRAHVRRHLQGAYFLAGDLPSDPAARDDLLLRIMGSPGPRQIDGWAGPTR